MGYMVSKDDGWRMPDWLGERVAALIPERAAIVSPVGYTPLAGGPIMRDGAILAVSPGIGACGEGCVSVWTADRCCRRGSSTHRVSKDGEHSPGSGARRGLLGKIGTAGSVCPCLRWARWAGAVGLGVVSARGWCADPVRRRAAKTRRSSSRPSQSREGSDRTRWRLGDRPSPCLG